MSRRPGRWWKPTGPQHRRPARVSRAHAAYRPEAEFMKGWDQGASETRQALDGENAFDAGYDLGQADQKRAGHDELDKVIGTSMEVGEMQGRKWGERDTYLELGSLLDDPDELIARISGRYLAERADLFLLVESARQNSPDEFRQLAEAVEEGEDAVAALADEWGVFPDGDDLLEVADAASVTPLDDGRYMRNARMVVRMCEADAAGPEAFAALAEEWGVLPEVLRSTPINDVLDVVEAARMADEIEAWLREQGGGE